MNIAAALHLQGAQASVYDPKAMESARASFPTLTYVPTLEDALRHADLVLLLTEWNEFVTLDPSWAGGLVTSPLILDGRNALDRKKWIEAGWEYRGIGRR